MARASITHAYLNHADWNDLHDFELISDANQIYIIFGYSFEFSQWLVDKGFSAVPVNTFFVGELDALNEQTFR